LENGLTQLACNILLFCEVVVSGENARIEIKTHGDDDTFWLVAYVNGFEVNGHVPVASIDDGSVKANRIDSMVREVYRRAYRDGFKACQSCVKDALGIAK
jgi:hypothetical protein